jgi:Flp pilus assembly pilin Flp
MERGSFEACFAAAPDVIVMGRSTGRAVLTLSTAPPMPASFDFLRSFSSPGRLPDLPFGQYSQTNMNSSIISSIRRFGRDDSGAAVTEYVVALGFVIVAVSVVLTLFGSKVMARWETVAGKLDGETTTVVHTTTSAARTAR